MSQPSTRPPLYKGDRFPPEIISRCVRLYYRFGVSLPLTLRFGAEYADGSRRRRGACSNTWHLDELCLMIDGERGRLWAFDDAGGLRLDSSPRWCPPGLDRASPVLIQGGNRNGDMAAQMKPVVAALPYEHIVAISGYLGSISRGS